MRRYLPLAIVVLVGLLSIGSGAALYRAKRPHILTIATDKTTKAGSSDVHILGNPNAPITLEEFGDYQCPPCGLLAEPLNKIEQEFRPRVRLIFYNFPLVNHQHARAAACAAEAAGLQNRFWEMHDLIFKQQASWTKASDVQTLFASYAGMIGIDVERFKKDSASEAVKARVDSDQKRGASIGVQNTPTVFLNNRAIAPADLAPDRIHAAVAAAIKGTASPAGESNEPKK